MPLVAVVVMSVLVSVRAVLVEVCGRLREQEVSMSQPRGMLVDVPAVAMWGG